MAHLINPQTSKMFPVWIAINGNKFVVAQDQQHAVDCFIWHYKMSPAVVINGLYAEKPDAGNNDSGRSLGQG